MKFKKTDISLYQKEKYKMIDILYDFLKENCEYYYSVNELTKELKRTQTSVRRALKILLIKYPNEIIKRQAFNPNSKRVAPVTVYAYF